MSVFKTIPVSEIAVGDRVRKEFKHLTILAESIRMVGLLHPVILNSRKELIAGSRRLEAVKRLGWTEVPVCIVASLDDAILALHAEQDENTCREHLSLSESVELGRRLEALEKPEAKKRQSEHGAAPGKPKLQITGGNFPPVITGKVRDKVGASVGMSGKTYEKAKAVEEAAVAEPAKYGPVRDEMNRTGKVEPAFKKVQGAGDFREALGEIEKVIRAAKRINLGALMIGTAAERDLVATQMEHLAEVFMQEARRIRTAA